MSDAPELLPRDVFRESVLARDGGRCVRCGAPAVDAHHLIERRLFSDGGYYLDNGVALCAPCHLDAERTLVSVEELRAAAGIARVVVPGHIPADEPIDKWGNPLLGEGRRGRGELFAEEAVQRVLRDGGVLERFDARFKYPRTWHLPSSPGADRAATRGGGNDRVLTDTAHLDGREVVVSEKLDGEATTMYRDGFHARSISSASHPSQSWCRGLWASIAHEIPAGWRICGENLNACHAIAYAELPSYFFVYSIWDETNSALSVDETAEWCELLGLEMVPEIYRGPFDAAAVTRAVLATPPPFHAEREGYVVRLAERFAYREFARSLAKWVRAGHVDPDSGHWRQREIVPNRLRADVS